MRVDVVFSPYVIHNVLKLV